MADTTLSLSVLLKANAKQLLQEFGKTDKANKKLSTSTDQLKQSVKNLFAAYAGYVSAQAALGFIKDSVLAYAEFDDAVRKAAATTQDFDTAYQQFAKTAQHYGETTRYSSLQAAEGLQYLSMAGLSIQESIDSLPYVLRLATAGSLELGDAADILTNILAQTGQGIDDLAHVNDVLVKAANSANTSVSDLGYAYKYVGPIATSLNIQFEEQAALLAVLANNGYKGETAGAALRGALASLLNPSKDANATLKRLGIQLYDSGGAMLSMAEIIEQFEGSAYNTRDALKIFGQEAGPAMVALLRQGRSEVDKYTQALEEADGTAQEAQQNMDGGLGKALADTSAAWDGLKTAIGKALEDDVTEWLQELQVWLRENKDAIVELAQEIVWAARIFAGWIETLISVALEYQNLIEVLAALLLAVKALGIISGLIGWLKTLGIVSAASSVSVGKLTSSLVGKAGLVGAAVAAGYALGSMVYEIEPVQSSLGSMIDTVTELFGISPNDVGAQALADQQAAIAAHRAEMEKTAEVTATIVPEAFLTAQASANKLSSALNMAIADLEGAAAAIEEQMTKASETAMTAIEAMASPFENQDAAVADALEAQLDQQAQAYQSHFAAINQAAEESRISQAEQIKKLAALVKDNAQQEFTAVTESYTQRETALSEFYTQAIEMAEASGNDSSELESEYQEKLKELYDERADAYQELQDKLADEHQKRIDKAKSLEEELADAQKTQAEFERDLRHEGMNEWEIHHDIRREAAEKRAQAEEALERGNFSLARELAGESAKLARESASSVKDSWEGRQNAIDDSRAAMDILAEATNKQVTVEKKAAAGIRSMMSQVQGALGGVQQKAQESGAALEKNLDTELKIKTDAAQAAVDQFAELAQKRLNALSLAEAMAQAQEDVLRFSSEVAKSETPLPLSIDLAGLQSQAREAQQLVEGIGAETEFTADFTPTIQAALQVEQDIAAAFATPHPVNADTSEAQAAITALQADTSSTHTVYVQTVEQHNAGGLAGGYQRRQGLIPGSGNTDTVPAMLTPGEFVLNKHAVQELGLDTVKQLNKGVEGVLKRPLFFSAGGIVPGIESWFSSLTKNGGLGGLGQQDFRSVRQLHNGLLQKEATFNKEQEAFKSESAQRRQGNKRVFNQSQAEQKSQLQTRLQEKQNADHLAFEAEITEVRKANQAAIIEHVRSIVAESKADLSVGIDLDYLQVQANNAQALIDALNNSQISIDFTDAIKASKGAYRDISEALSVPLPVKVDVKDALRAIADVQAAANDVQIDAPKTQKAKPRQSPKRSKAGSDDASASDVDLADLLLAAEGKKRRLAAQSDYEDYLLGTIKGVSHLDTIKEFAPGRQIRDEKIAKLTEFLDDFTLDDAPDDVPDDVLDILQLNTGGLVPGSGNTDTVPAMLTPGEFVLPKDVVKQVGSAALEKLRGGLSASVSVPELQAQPGTVQMLNQGGLVQAGSTETVTLRFDFGSRGTAQVSGGRSDLDLIVDGLRDVSKRV
jgi:TP901 family phage tail tape measure protein